MLCLSKLDVGALVMEIGLAYGKNVNAVPLHFNVRVGYCVASELEILWFHIDGAFNDRHTKLPVEGKAMTFNYYSL